MKTIIPIITILTFAGCAGDKIDWITTNPSEQWQTNKVLIERDASKIVDSAIRIFPENYQQIIDGFGGCFNELGWEALMLLTEKERNRVLNSLFHPTDGSNFNLCRMPMGANDYAIDWYSHNETVDDFQMHNFSIERDEKRLIPYILKAKVINPDLRIWASPWAPPSWMKTNNHYACRSDIVNDLPEESQGEEMVTQFRMEHEYLRVYALYFSKFIEAYRNHSIDIYAVHVQNEPNSCQAFPSCIWHPRDLATFIGEFLGPQFESDGLDTEIWLGTIERPHIERIDEIMNHNEAQKYIRGIGFQWAGKGAIPQVHKKYPDMKLMQTETECGDGSNDWEAAEYTFELMKHYFNNGANSYLYWNMILDETGRSRWGWKQNAMITIDSETKKVTYNPEFFLMKHFSRFIKPGFYKIETSDPGTLAFKSSEKIVIIYFNVAQEEKKQFVVNDKIFEMTLPEQSINTFIVRL
jgi:glucosylceramidase